MVRLPLSGAITMAISTPEQNLRLLRDSFDALERHDLDACCAAMTEDFLINIAEMPYQKKGQKAWRQHAGQLLAAFPDVRVTIDDAVAAGDKVAIRATITGTHRGEFIGNPPTGKAVSYKSHEVYRFANGKIAEEWICSDMMTLLTQLGALSGGRMLAMWLAGVRVWFALAAGLVVGVLAGAMLL